VNTTGRVYRAPEKDYPFFGAFFIKRGEIMERRLRVVVIGAGIVGALIAREFTKYACDVCLLEQEIEAGWGVTKANSAIVHGGYDDEPATIRAKFCAQGNQMYDSLSKELNIDFQRTGSYVLAFSDEDILHLEGLLTQAKTNGVIGCRIDRRDEVLTRQPKLNKMMKAAFWCPSAGITEPWMIAMAAVESMQLNGGRFFPGNPVIGVDVDHKGAVRGVRTSQEFFHADIVVNASGLYADRITQMVGLDPLLLYPRKGEYILLDKKMGSIVSAVIFPVPTKQSKGILVVPTVDGGVLLGPTAEDLDQRCIEDTSTTRIGLERIKSLVHRLVPDIDESQTVKTFAGLRPETPLKDFVVGPTEIKGFFQAAAMRSPGLTSAPAIAKYMATEAVQEGIGIQLTSNPHFRPNVPKYIRTSEQSLTQWDELVAKDPRYGKMICVCNKITEGEIRDAIIRGARTVDGIKFRTRAGFGHCQGGFCLPKVVELLQRYGHIPMDQLTLRGKASALLSSEVRT